MSVNNVTILVGANASTSPMKRYQTEAAATAILYGEPVKLKSAGSEYVIPLADAEPVVGTTTAVIGIAAANSTQTSTADGIVDVFEALPGAIYLCAPKVSTTIDTQAEYNALVNTPVLFDLTAGVYTVDTGATASTSGLVIQPLEIAKYPNKVAFLIRQSATINN
jgi:hypothetical protein